MAAPVPPRQLAALCAVADTLGRAGVRWVLTGSAGRALLGCPVRPRDIDLEVHREDADTAAAAMGTPLADEGGAGRHSWRGGALRAGIEVDITADLVVEGPGGRLGADFGRQWEWSHPVSVGGRAIRVAPLEEGICRALVLGDWAHLAKVTAQAASATPAIRLSAGYVAERLSCATASATR